MNYTDFINEIRSKLDESKSLFNKEERDRDSDFRKWRHNLTAAIEIIESHNYDVKCTVKNRRFTIGGYADGTMRMRRYNEDLQDTINELETIINYYDNYGEPKLKTNTNTDATSARELEYPQKVTLSWLAKHAPINLWLKFTGIIIASFILGLGFSQTIAYKKVQQLWEDKHPVQSDQVPNNALQQTPKSGAAEFKR